MKKGRTAVDDREDNVRIQEFLDMIAPSVIKFETDHFICGNTYRCVWALREYPTATEEQAILSHLGEKDGVTLRSGRSSVMQPTKTGWIGAIPVIYSRLFWLKVIYRM